jgi:hypothetical protein
MICSSVPLATDARQSATSNIEAEGIDAVLAIRNGFAAGRQGNGWSQADRRGVFAVTRAFMNKILLPLNLPQVRPRDPDADVGSAPTAGHVVADGGKVPNPFFFAQSADLVLGKSAPRDSTISDNDHAQRTEEYFLARLRFGPPMV